MIGVRLSSRPAPPALLFGAVVAGGVADTLNLF